MNQEGSGSLAAFDRETRARALDSLLKGGVFLPDPERVFVDPEAKVSAGAVLLPGTYIIGACSIGAGCRIGPDCWIEDSKIEDQSVVRYSVLEGARVREGSIIGPYTHLRPGADIGPRARVGNFVEVKAARLGEGVKAGHLSYIGDAEIGEGVNVGAGAVTCNYDGVAKHRTVIEDGAFIGTNASLVAPVTIGKDAVVGAGSTITKDVPPESLALGRARQVVKDRTAEDRNGEGRDDA